MVKIWPSKQNIQTPQEVIHDHHVRNYDFRLILTYVSFGDQIDQIPPFSNLTFVLKVAEAVGHAAH